MEPRILVVDDSTLARKWAKQSLGELGYSVDEASNGDEAIERYSETRHEAVLLDLVMPGTYGLDVLAKLRRLNPQVKIIIVTADIQTCIREDAEALGAFAVINKPLRKEALSVFIKDVFQAASKFSP